MDKFHPLSIIVLTGTLFLLTLVYTHPLYIIGLNLFIIGIFLSIGRLKELKKTIVYILYTGTFIIIINPLVSSAGRTILYRSPRLPIIGVIKITMESLSYGVVMVLKLMCISWIFMLYSNLTDKDDNFEFFSKYAYKLTLTMSMTVNIIHRLKIEISRVREVMILRGVNFEDKNLKKRIEAYYPLIKVVLMSALEGSLNRAEALYSREYGQGKRTFYTENKVKVTDYILIILTLIFICVSIGGYMYGAGTYEFYPRLDSINKMDLIHLSIMSGIGISIIVFVRGCKKRIWTFLKLTT